MDTFAPAPSLSLNSTSTAISLHLIQTLEEQLKQDGSHQNTHLLSLPGLQIIGGGGGGGDNYISFHMICQVCFFTRDSKQSPFSLL